MTIEGSASEMHRIVQFATRKWLEAQSDIKLWRHKFLKSFRQNNRPEALSNGASVKFCFRTQPWLQQISRPIWNHWLIEVRYLQMRLGMLWRKGGTRLAQAWRKHGVKSDWYMRENIRARGSSNELEYVYFCAVAAKPREVRGCGGDEQAGTGGK